MPDVEVRLTQVYKAFRDDAAGRRVAKYIQPDESGLIVAVDHIDLEVRDGEFFSLLGPSGCGKTTTLRMIGGFEQPTSGKIELAGPDGTLTTLTFKVAELMIAPEGIRPARSNRNNPRRTT